MKALLIDIGNSRVKGRLIDTLADITVEFEPTSAALLPGRWQGLDATIDLALISNVAGSEVEASLVRWLIERSPTVRIERVVPEPTTMGVINGYRQPARLGSDRWMALVGAHALFPDRSLLVCGFGTATTFDLLQLDDRRRDVTFVGGVILPGVDAMRAALLARTARLDVEAGVVVDFADNTEDAISSGVVLAQVGALREACERARRRTAGPVECVIAGGAGRLIGNALHPIDFPVHHVPDLVIRGLAVLAGRRVTELGVARVGDDA